MTRNTQENNRSSSQQTWFAKLPDPVWSPLASGFLVLVVGLIGLAAHQPWLFPSLGPTAFLLVENPQLPSARYYNTIVGHLVGLAAGFLAVALLGAGDAPPVLSSNELSPVRVWAAVLAVVLNMLGVLLLKASHPPSAATTLLAALGSFKITWHNTFTITVGVLIVATLGEVLRFLRLGKGPQPT